MSGEQKIVVKTDSGAWFGALWPVGWLFTIGFLKLGFWKGVLALLLWPYYLGVRFGG